MSILSNGLREHLHCEDLKRLGSARIGIAGAGGLGSNVAMLLVRSGVKRFVLVDSDAVEPSNLNRQWFRPEDVGKRKVLALCEQLRSLEPDVECEARAVRLDPVDAGALFAGCDVVVEAFDAAPAKAALCSRLISEGFFVVAASGLAGFGLPPMQTRRLGARLVCVGDFTSGVSRDTPVLAPRVMQAAALQADAVLARLLRPDA